MKWFNDNEREIFRLGWLIGFFNGDGAFSIAKKGYYSVIFTQKLRAPLEKAKMILEDNDIHSKIQGRSSRTDRWKLRIFLDDIPKFIDLCEGRLSGQKAVDLSIFKKLVELRENYDGRDWKVANEKKVDRIVQEWKRERESYHNKWDE